MKRARGARHEARGGETDRGAQFRLAPGAQSPAPVVRLQKVIADSGLTSRRKAEEMMKQGRVTVNGEVVRELHGPGAAGGHEILASLYFDAAEVVAVELNPVTASLLAYPDPSVGGGYFLPVGALGS